ncbi:oligosaccharide flippase family protein [Bacteroides fragilis]|uniref:lipopolysaccharide biosynthesis protein n=1 Tax=Bacteroides TaxID=816 RepID=UPI001C389EF9|nr:oligosaccharide flippase family protein [Bacteroides fragilis]MBV4191512.1 oligosaccharide flippase family protein [Bacteroides fragilis]MCE8613627.1 oligosaccharide flippase family protein [Bacteroides fragilis]MCE8616084.1 oligosaccharide flippase family protein [Bacteroides fragilis]MCM0277935.1 oligosaccharide flippase family protein [Bacteroides fragilis]MCZ2602956.1 oligosaccharide flippase family protein [Bacteroides fragilis]
MRVMIRIKRKIDSSPFLKSVVVLFSGNVFANLISFLSIPILSRIYSDIAFGDYAIVISTAAIVNGISTLGLTSAIMIPVEENKAKSVFTTAWISHILVSTFCFVLALILLPVYSIYSITGSYSCSLLLMYLYVLLVGTFSLLSVYANRLRKNRILFWNAMINSLALLCLAIPFGLWGWGGTGFLMASTGGYLVANIQMLYHMNPFKKIAYRDCISVYKGFKDFVIYQFPSNLISTFTIQLPNQLFSAYFGNASLGGYAMCERILGVPMRLIGAPITTIYFRHSSECIRECKDISGFTYILITRILILAFLPVLILFSCSEVLFTFILGDSWLLVGKIVSILIFPYVLLFCSNCVSYCLVVIGKQKINLYLSLLYLMLIVASVVSGFYIFSDFVSVVICFAVALIVFNLLNLLVIFYYLRKDFGRFVKFIGIYLLSIYLGFILIKYL